LNSLNIFARVFWSIGVPDLNLFNNVFRVNVMFWFR